MSSSTEAQRLIALSLGKIAMSRQQRGGINLHKNLLVASVLHKARTTYMMDNFQTLLANKRAQAEREAAAKMIVETPSEKVEEKTMDTSCQSRGVTDCNKANDTEVHHGDRPEKNNNVDIDKENVVPIKENRVDNVENALCDKSDASDKKSSPRDITNNNTPVVTGKLPLSQHNGNSNYVSQLASCRCTGGKRRRSFVDCDSVTEPKKPRFEEEYENSDSDDSEYESESGDNYENMQTTESSQVKSLVDIFSTGFNGLCKDNDTKQQQSTGHINVYVSADRSLGHQYVLKDISCGTQIKDNVALHTAIALAV